MKNLMLLAAGAVAVSCPLLAGTPAAPIPEPSTTLLMAGGLGVMILIARKVRARKK